MSEAEITEPLLEFSDIGLVAGAIRLLDQVSFAIAPGQRLAIVGDSGTGKSMILRLALGLSAPGGGVVRLFGRDLAGLDLEGRRIARSRCGIAFQGSALVSGLDVEDNLWLGLGASGASRARLRRRLDRVALDFGIEHAGKIRAEALSSGERRRVELARAFIREPELVILDEPLDGVSANAAALEEQIRRQIVPRGRSLLLLTQDAALAERLCPHVYRLSQGRLVQQTAGVAESVPALA